MRPDAPNLVIETMRSIIAAREAQERQESILALVGQNFLLRHARAKEMLSPVEVLAIDSGFVLVHFLETETGGEDITTWLPLHVILELRRTGETPPPPSPSEPTITPLVS